MLYQVTIKFAGEKKDLQKIFLKFVLLFQKNLNFVFCFCEEFLLQRKMNFDVENENFKNIFFNLLDAQIILNDDNNSPDINFFNKKSEAVNQPYYNMDKFNSSSQNLLKNSFYVLLEV